MTYIKFPIRYIKDCPKCGCEQEYARKGGLVRAKKLNLVCKQCSTSQSAKKGWETRRKNGTDHKTGTKDMGERPSHDYHIHRVDNDKGYYKENCVWITSKEHFQIHHPKGQKIGNINEKKTAQDYECYANNQIKRCKSEEQKEKNKR